MQQTTQPASAKKISELDLPYKGWSPMCPWNFQSRPVSIDSPYGTCYMKFLPI